MLDPARARAEADAAERRGAGTLWGAEPVEWEAVSVGAVAQPEVVPVVEGVGAESPPSRPRVAELPRRAPPPGTQEMPTALLAAILARLEMAPTPGGIPAWLVDAIGNPLSYDAAAPHRKDVCALVDPALCRRLQAMKERLRLRTTAGAWEYVLRAGLAAAERNPVPTR